MEIKRATNSGFIAIMSCVLFLGIIPCDAALFTFFKDASLGKDIVLALNLAVCAIAAFFLIRNFQTKYFYERISTKFAILFLFMIIMNLVAAVLSDEVHKIGTRTMSLVCLCAYYVYSMYIFGNAHTLISSINKTLLILIVFSFVLYYVDYQHATYIEDATTRLFKGVALNRNSYGEITIFYTASNLYLWFKSRKHHLFYIATTALALYTTYITHSATATVCVVCMIILAIMYITTKRIIPFKLIIVGYAVIYILMIILQSGRTPFLGAIIEYFGKDPTLTGRTEIWSTTLNLLGESPIFGKGFDSYSLYYEGVNSNDPHNSILYMLWTQGIVGTIVLISLFYGTISKAEKLLKDEPLFAFMYIFILVWMVRGLTESAFTYTHFVFWIAIVVIEMLLIEKNHKSELDDVPAIGTLA